MSEHLKSKKDLLHFSSDVHNEKIKKLDRFKNLQNKFPSIFIPGVDPTFVFLCFPIFAFKLECLWQIKNYEFTMKRPSLTAKKWKNYAFTKNKSFGRIDSRTNLKMRPLSQLLWTFYYYERAFDIFLSVDQ